MAKLQTIYFTYLQFITEINYNKNYKEVINLKILIKQKNSSSRNVKG